MTLAPPSKSESRMSASSDPAIAVLAGGRPGGVLVLGLGNDILCDDAAGLRVAEAVGAQFGTMPGITALASLEMGLSLLDLISGYDTLLLVDAVQTGKVPPGHLHELTPEDLEVVPRMSPHFLGIGDLLALGTLLDLDMPPTVRIFAIEVQEARTLGTRLTPSVEAALPAVVARIAAAAQGAA
jgi:hydrogenase maturation protease